MELHFTPEQETRLLQIAAHEEKTPEQVVFDATLNFYRQDDHVRQFIRERLPQADQGVFIEEEEMDARFQKMMQS